jgi:hypothetical protein
LLIDAGDRVAQFGQSIEIRASAVPTVTAQPGETLAWPLRLRALRGLDRAYSVFLHLYRVDAAGIADDQRILAQGDQQMCASYPTVQWSPDEVAIETYNLTLPPDIPAGQYVAAIGVYDSETGERLAVTNPPAAGPMQFAPLQHIRVNP